MVYHLRYIISDSQSPLTTLALKNDLEEAWTISSDNDNFMFTFVMKMEARRAGKGIKEETISITTISLD